MDWFFIALGIGVLVGILALFGQKECPHCRKRIDRRATACPHCQRDMPDQVKESAPAMDRWAQRFGDTPPEEERPKSSFEREKRKSKAWVPITILLVLVVAMVVAYTDRSEKKLQSSRETPPRTTQANPSTVTDQKYETIGTEDQIKVLLDTGLLKRIDAKMNEAFVDPAIWHATDFKTKEGIGAVLAFYCGRVKGTGLNWVTIRDNRSGKNLAKYSEAWGFKVY